METKREQNFRKSREKGNALIYVLIAIALFAALGFTLSRQTQNANTSDLDDAKAELFANQLISTAAQMKSAVDQMMITGSKIDDLDFSLSGQASFDTPPHIHKVFHPEGGGILRDALPRDVKQEVSGLPESGWYMGAFNNVEWTPTAQTDVLLTAHEISQAVCGKINEKITGSTDIPVVSGNLNAYLVDGSIFSGTNSDLDATVCPDCENYQSLCVSNNSGTAFSFYTVIAQR